MIVIKLLSTKKALHKRGRRQIVKKKQEVVIQVAKEDRSYEQGRQVCIKLLESASKSYNK